MKKFLVAVIIIVLLLAGGVGYYLYSHKSQIPMLKQPQGGSVFSSITDALSKSLSLQCTFTDDKHHKTTAYIKAGAVRADIMGNDPTQQYNSSSVIIKDKKMYMWDTVKKQGMVLELNDEEVMPTSVQEQSGSSSQNAGDVMAMLEKYKQYCKPAVVSDTLFTAPADVAFQDFSKMTVPTTAASGGMSQQDVQKMMQQYQQQAPHEQ